MLSQEWPSLKLKRGNTLILATHNQGKLEEFKTLLSLYDLNINSSGNLGIEEPEETENTFEGNALLKAKGAVLDNTKKCYKGKHEKESIK